MGMPQEATNEIQAETQPSPVPANTNTRNVVDVAGVLNGLEALEAQAVSLETQAASMRRQIIDMKAQIAAAGVEAVVRAPDAKVELIEAPAIILRRSLGEAISRGDLKPGQKLPGKDIILVAAWEPTNRAGEGLGRKIVSFGAPENLPGDPRTFEQNAAKIGDLTNWHGHDGWKFDRQRSGTPSYEDARFNAYKDGSAIGKWGVPELPILNGNDRYGRSVNPDANMLTLSNKTGADKNAFNDNFVTIPDSVGAKFSQACTEVPDDSGCVLSVHFPVGLVVWDPKDDVRSCVRPSLTLELSHLIL